MVVREVLHSLLSTMHVPFLNSGLSLATLSLLASCVTAEVFEQLAAVPAGMFVYCQQNIEFVTY